MFLMETINNTRKGQLGCYPKWPKITMEHFCIALAAYRKTTERTPRNSHKTKRMPQKFAILITFKMTAITTNYVNF